MRAQPIERTLPKIQKKFIVEVEVRRGGGRRTRRKCRYSNSYGVRAGSSRQPRWLTFPHPRPAPPLSLSTSFSGCAQASDRRDVVRGRGVRGAQTASAERAFDHIYCELPGRRGRDEVQRRSCFQVSARALHCIPSHPFSKFLLFFFKLGTFTSQHTSIPPFFCKMLTVSIVLSPAYAARYLHFTIGKWGLGKQQLNTNQRTQTADAPTAPGRRAHLIMYSPSCSPLHRQIEFQCKFHCLLSFTIPAFLLENRRGTNPCG